VDESLLELLDDDEEDEELESDDPPVDESLLELLDSSGMSVHVAWHRIEKARRRILEPSTVSLATEAPISCAP
jgi:hypothetical protein